MILVTGGAGLLGSTLIEHLLKKNLEVTAIYNKTVPSINSGLLKIVQCDLLDVVGLAEVMEGITQVYHCAGFVSFEPGDERKLYKMNVEAVANVVNAALDAGVQKLVHVSSVAALGRFNRNEPVNEHMEWLSSKNSSGYAFSKYLGEMEVWRGIAEGLNAVIINPSVILGAGNWQEGSTAIFKSAYDEFNWYSEGENGFVDVRDVAEAMILLMESDVTAQRFIINGTNTSYRNIFNLAADSFGKKRPSRKVTPFLASVVYRLEHLKHLFTGKKPLVTKHTAETALQKISYDNSKFLQAFPSFSYRKIEDTISYSCRLLQQKLNNP